MVPLLQSLARAQLLCLCATAASTVTEISTDRTLQLVRRLQQSFDGEPRTSIRFGATFGPRTQAGTEAFDTHRGYTFWADFTNSQGGIAIRGTDGVVRQYAVELIARDDSCGSVCEHAAQVEVEANYRALIHDDGVDILLGTSTKKTAIMSRVADELSTINVACCSGPASFYSEGRAWLFGMHVPSDFYSRDYLKTMSISRNPATGRPVKNVAIAHNTRTTFTNATCSAAASFAREYGMQVVFNEPFDPAVMDAYAYRALMSRVKNAPSPAEVFIGCTLVDDSIAITRAAHDVGLLPQQLTSLFLTVGPTKPVFIETLGNLSEFVVAPSQWHHSMRYSDPYFGSSQEMNTLFKRLYGYDMDYVTASAVAAGVALRLALEQASEPTSTSTHESLTTDDCMTQTETFFGVVRMSAQGHAQGSQRNIGHPPALLQIVNGETVCVLPVDAASAMLQIYRTPEITLAGCADCAQFVEANRTLATTFAEPGVSAMGMRGEPLQVSSRWTSAAYDAASPGYYNLEYTAQDRSGFLSRRFREVGKKTEHLCDPWLARCPQDTSNLVAQPAVVKDSQPPQIILLTSEHIQRSKGNRASLDGKALYVQFGSAFGSVKESGYEAFDSLDGDLTAHVISSIADYAGIDVADSDVTKHVRNLTQTLRVLDAAGNTSPLVQRTIFVVCDTNLVDTPEDLVSTTCESRRLALIVLTSVGALLMCLCACAKSHQRAVAMRSSHNTTFISHSKRDGGDVAGHLNRLLDKRMLGGPWSTRGRNFLDVEDLTEINAETLVSEVKRSKVFVLLLTRSLLTRPWCLVEIFIALQAGKPFVPIVVKVPNKPNTEYSFGMASSFLSKLTTRLFDQRYMERTWGENAWKPDGWEVEALASVKTVSPEQYNVMSPVEQLRVVKTPEGEKLTLAHIQRRLCAELPGKSAMSFNMQVSGSFAQRQPSQVYTQLTWRVFVRIHGKCVEPTRT